MDAHILLVDDNEDFLDSIRDVLELEGYRVVAVSSGEQALAATQATAFDVILMDIKMPGMNGVETFVKMKATHPHVKVIFFTAYSKSELIRHAREAGAYAIFSKPLNLSELLQTVAEANREKSDVCILLADDDQDFCDNIRDSLAGEGYRIEVAHDSEDAESMANERTYDILLLDMKLPPRNGLAVYRRLKTRQPDLAVIIISGYVEEMVDMIRRALSENAHACIPKPVNMNRLLELIGKIAGTPDRK